MSRARFRNGSTRHGAGTTWAASEIEKGMGQTKKGAKYVADFIQAEENPSPGYRAV
jgi:hypothetical protein